MQNIVHICIIYKYKVHLNIWITQKVHALISIVVLDIHMTDIDINDRTDKYNISNDKYNILKQS